MKKSMVAIGAALLTASVFAQGESASSAATISPRTPTSALQPGECRHMITLPSNERDPIGLGAGLRALRIGRPAGTDSRHGLVMARLTGGVDDRFSSQLAISPDLDIGLTTFLTQDLAGQLLRLPDVQSFSNVPGPDVNVWMSAGLQARFNFFGGSDQR